MENYKITKEQILAIEKVGGADVSLYLKEIIPEAFNTKLDTGKWYKGSADIKFLICYQSNGNDNYGFWRDQPYKDNLIFGDCWYNMSRLATDEEVSAVLKKEAQKLGFKKGVSFISLFSNGTNCRFNPVVEITEDEFLFQDNTLLTISGYRIFANGKWAQILPQKKTIVPMEKALKIIAKKMKVSPENIEIKN